jgi:hypothetical protein
MALDPRALDDLSRFLATRFADAAPRLCARAGLPIPVAPSAAHWSDVLAGADDDALKRLSDVLAAEAPEDVTVAAACRELRGTRAALYRIALVVAFLGFASAGALYALDAQRRAAPVVAPPPPAREAPLPTTEPAVAEGEGLDEADDPPPIPDTRQPLDPSSPLSEYGPTPPPDALAAASAAPPAPAVQTPAPRERVRRPPADPPVPRCDAVPGTVRGWWYAGKNFTGKQGQVVIVGRGSKVRSKAPLRTDEDHRQGAVLCYIPTGGIVRLSGPPVDASPNGWWAPFTNGDLIVEEAGPVPPSPSGLDRAAEGSAAPDAP